MSIIGVNCHQRLHSIQNPAIQPSTTGNSNVHKKKTLRRPPLFLLRVDSKFLCHRQTPFNSNRSIVNRNNTTTPLRHPHISFMKFILIVFKISRTFGKKVTNFVKNFSFEKLVVCTF